MHRNKHVQNIISGFGSRVALILSIVFLAVPEAVRAQVDKHLKELSGSLPGDDLPKLIANIIRAGLGLVGTVALAFFIYGGFMYITSGGDEKQIEQGKKIMVYAIIGILAIGLSYAVVTFVIGAFGGGTPGVVR